MGAFTTDSKLKLCLAFQVPGRAITVQINQDVVSSLYSDLRRSARLSDQERSGLLIGRIDGQDEVTITLEAHRPGSVDQEPPVVGAYHIATAESLQAIEQFRNAFRGRHSVFLSIRPGRGGAPIAEMYVGSPERGPGETPDLRFLLDPGQLDRQQEPRRQLAEPAGRDLAPAAQDLVPPEASDPGRSFRLPLMIGGAAVVVAALLYWRPQSKPAPVPDVPILTINPAAGRNRLEGAAPLGLKVDVLPNALRVTWDRDSGLNQNAVHGTLQIRDGEKFRDISLAKSQLQNGSLLYVSQTDDLDLRLEIITPDMQRYTEFLKVIGAGMPRIARSVPEDAVLRAPAAPSPKAAAQPPAQIAAVKEFSPPQARSTLTAAAPGLLTPAPVIEAEKSTSSATLVPAPNLSTPGMPQPSPAASVTAPAAARQFVEPVLVRRNSIGIPPGMRHLLPNVVMVKVRVTIDSEGRVVRSEPGPQKIGFQSNLAMVVAAGVRSWRFSPAQLNGKPVQSDMELQVAIRREEAKPR